MQTIPPFVILTHGDPVLNEAVQHLCFARGMNWFGKTEIRRLNAEQLSNCFPGDLEGHSELAFADRIHEGDFKPHVRRFDAHNGADFLAFVQFLANPPKPEPKFRPWTYDEVTPGMVVMRQGFKCLISTVEKGGVWLTTNRGQELWTFADILNSDWTQLDGTPCGVEVTE